MGPLQRAVTYCTMFDMGYMARGLALIASLRDHGDESPVLVLALDQGCADYLGGLAVPGVDVITVERLIEAVPALGGVRHTRTPVEFIFTCTASLVDFALHRCAPDGWVVYLDSDMAFFNDPGPIFDAAFDGSVGIIPHRYSPRLGHLRKYGTYNVGWVMFRNDRSGRTCSAWWRDATIDWCHDYPDAGRYADQGYLDQFGEIAAGVKVLDDPGLNLAPWNLGGHDVRLQGDRLVVDREAALVFYHFQGLRHEGGVWYPNLRPYRTRLDPLVRASIYEPYIAELMAIEAGRHPINRSRPLGVRTTTSGSRDHFGWRARARRARRAAVNALDRISGQVIRDDMVAPMCIRGERIG